MSKQLINLRIVTLFKKLKNINKFLSIFDKLSEEKFLEIQSF